MSSTVWSVVYQLCFIISQHSNHSRKVMTVLSLHNLATSTDIYLMSDFITTDENKSSISSYLNSDQLWSSYSKLP